MRDQIGWKITTIVLVLVLTSGLLGQFGCSEKLTRSFVSPYPFREIPLVEGYGRVQILEVEYENRKHVFLQSGQSLSKLSDYPITEKEKR